MTDKREKRLGQILIDAGLLSEAQVKKVLASQNGKSFSCTVVDLGFAREREIAKTLAERLGLTHINLGDYEINPGAATMVSEEMARKYQALPIDFEEDRLVVAIADPTNIVAIDDLRVITGYRIKSVVCTESELQTAIAQYSKMDRMVEEVIDSVASGAESEVEVETREEQEAQEAPIAKLVNLIIAEAARKRAGDVHVEPQEEDLRVRYRIDGVLYETMRSSKKIQAGVISRLKIMAGMDISERRLPQDGRFGLVIDGKPIDFRAATLPTVHGEKVILRLLEKESALMKLEDLGLSKRDLERFRAIFIKPYGAVLVTGPTGCGKTTTLYAVVNILNQPEKNIITVEDPIEYRLPGINQVQVDPKAELTFARGLRSILRNDPDTVMIGEVRDSETASITVESALTGHMVLSTLHTNNAPSALTRLIEMGVEPFLISSAIDVVVAQRLARRLCRHCREEYKPPLEALKEVNFPLEEGKIPTLYRAKGCNKCDDTGYQGRIGLFEVMITSEEVERLVVKKATSDEIKKVALKEGMRTLIQDGFKKAREGIISIDEVMRVTV